MHAGDHQQQASLALAACPQGHGHGQRHTWRRMHGGARLVAAACAAVALLLLVRMHVPTLQQAALPLTGRPHLLLRTSSPSPQHQARSQSQPADLLAGQGAAGPGAGHEMPAGGAAGAMQGGLMQPAASGGARYCVMDLSSPPRQGQASGSGSGSSGAGGGSSSSSSPIGAWTLSNGNGSIVVEGAPVPGYVLQALVQAGLAQEPLYRFNEVAQRWVALDTWAYATHLHLTAAQLARGCGTGSSGSSGSLELVLGGVDTLAHVHLNGVLLARLENFHRSYRLQLCGVARAGPNRLAITLLPVLPAIDEAAARYPYEMPSNTAPGAFPHFSFVRKPASDMGWDWGPAITPAGVHGRVALRSYSAPQLAGLHVLRQRHWSKGSSGRPSVSLTVEVEVWAPPALATPGDAPWLGVDRVEGVAAAAAAGYDNTNADADAVAQEADEEDDSCSEAEALPGGGPGREHVCGQGQGQGALLLRRRHTWGGTLVVQVAGTPLAARVPLEPLAAGQNFVRVQLGPVPLPPSAVWWPVGLGAQPLFNLTARWEPPEAAAAAAAGAAAGTAAEGSAPGGANRPWPSGVASGQGAEADDDDDGNDDGAGWSWSCTSTSQQQARRIGFRTVELVRVPLGEAFSELVPGANAQEQREATLAPGESFFFRVNGVPLYARGANLVPLDVLHARVGPGDVRALLEAALLANMNMIRVWGGGLYQQDALYEFCDEAGLLVWQELMFACNPYPRTRYLQDQIAAEASQQVRRLSPHPSVALWGGNNEVEASISLAWFNATRDNPAPYVADYQATFVELLGGIVARLDPLRPYLDSSPSSGLHTSSPPIKRWGDPQDPSKGDVHYYDYTADCLNASAYPRAKFISEHGVQSLASFGALGPTSQPQDWAPFSGLVRDRQRHPNGEAELLAALALHFKLPPSWQQRHAAHRRHQQQQQQGQQQQGQQQQGQANVGSGGGAQVPGSGPGPRAEAGDEGHGLAQLRAWTYLLQAQQAMCLSTALGVWRRLRSDPQALTMGVLYWQLNDIWPGYSWSSLDYRPSGGGTGNASSPTAAGRGPSQAPAPALAPAPGYAWKAAHHAVARAFAPVAVVGFLEDGNVTAWLVNDTPHPVAGVKLRVRLVPLGEEAERAAAEAAAAGSREEEEEEGEAGKAAAAGGAAPAPAPSADHDGRECACGSSAPLQRTAVEVSVDIPPQRSMRAFSAPLGALLTALPGCTPATCIVALDAHAHEVSTQQQRQQQQGREAPWQQQQSAGGEPGIAGASWDGGVGHAALHEAAQGMAAAAGRGMDAAGPGAGAGTSPWAASAMVLLAAPKDLQLLPPNISIVDVQPQPEHPSLTAKAPDSGAAGGGAAHWRRWCFTLRAQHAALLVWLEMEGSVRGRFEDNLITLRPCPHSAPAAAGGGACERGSGGGGGSGWGSGWGASAPGGGSCCSARVCFVAEQDVASREELMAGLVVRDLYSVQQQAAEADMGGGVGSSRGGGGGGGGQGAGPGGAALW